ncbi:MAG TPA: hypothetical protein G4N91_05065 [Dehalococcoidia bacterium]|nr:hypothetical protein [Dehalococcoidia bacterium]
MQIAALLLGILGGLWELIIGISAVAFGGWISEAGGFGDLGGAVIGIGVVIIILALCGIIGGGIVMVNAKAGGILILVAALGMVILAVFGPHWASIIPAIALITGGVLGLLASKETV